MGAITKYFDEHRGLRFLLYTSLLVVPVVTILMASMFLNWTARNCGPGATELCGPLKEGVAYIFSLSFSTCVLLLLAPVCGGCFYSYCFGIAYMPSEIVGACCFVASVATGFSALYFYFTSGIVFADGVFSAYTYGQWLFLLGIFGIPAIGAIYGIRRAISYRDEQKLIIGDFADDIKEGEESQDTNSDHQDDLHDEHMSMLDGQNSRRVPPPAAAPKLSLIKQSQDWASKSLTNIVKSTSNIVSPKIQNDHPAAPAGRQLGSKSSGNIEVNRVRKQPSRLNVEANRVLIDSNPTIINIPPRLKDLRAKSEPQVLEKAAEVLAAPQPEPQGPHGALPPLGALKTSVGQAATKSFVQRKVARDISDILDTVEPTDEDDETNDSSEDIETGRR